jgi:hypothetical protein
VRRHTILSFLVAALLLAPAAARADINVADVAGPTKVNAYGGRAVWSAFDASTQENRLMTRVGDGPVEAVPIAPTPHPFEADLGPAPDGHIVAVYPRCEPGCDIFEFDFASGRESKVPGASSARFDEFPATIFKSRIAFARRPSSRPGQIVLDLRLIDGGRSRALAGGATRNCFGSGRRRTCERVERIDVADLQLSASRLAFVWTRTKGDGRQREVYSSKLGAAPKVVARSSSGALSDGQLFTPSYAGDWLYFGFSRFGDGPTRSRYVRARLGSGRLEDAVAPPLLTAVAVDGARTYYALQENEFPSCQGDPPTPATLCHVRFADPVPAYRPYAKTRFGPGYGPPPRR